MRFKTDEYLPVEVTEMLRQHQHDALSVHDQQIAGQADPGIARVCQTEARALVTCDLDCADIRAYPPDNYHGIIVLRPAIQSVASLVRLTRRHSRCWTSSPWMGTSWSWMIDHRVRIRGAGSQRTP